MGFYPERRETRESKLDKMVISALGSVKNWIRARPSRFKKIVERVNSLQEAYIGLDEQELGSKADGIRQDFKKGSTSLDLVARAFALVREVAGIKLGMRHFDVQLVGGWVLLNGMVAEMETGEGKTMTAILPACTSALAGIPVHIITVNDYLAKRDAETMGPVYKAIGISVGVVVNGMSLEERQDAYGCDVTYCTNKELVFDYLKDRLVFGQKPGHIQVSVQRLYGSKTSFDQLRCRGLYFAIVDETDSVLIDEARIPLIISGSAEGDFEEDIYRQAFELSMQLKNKDDYVVDSKKKLLDLTVKGKSNLGKIADPLGGIWKGKRRREELVCQALVAQHLFIRDKDYIVREKKIEIVDEYTGRSMADRTWERGLHQLIEVKEGCDISPQNVTKARISYQRFFQRYQHLAGMTGTAREVARELWIVYRLPVVNIPTHKPVLRRAGQKLVYLNDELKWYEIVKRIESQHLDERPVLVGTHSVAASEHLSKLLSDKGLPHRVLNARQDKEEAEIIAEAGYRGKITVATNMAGRGTDIKLTDEVKEIGGLHVIATEYHDSKRVDRQLFGRCGRQGDPGSYEIIASMKDDLLDRYRETYKGYLIGRWINHGSKLGRWVSDIYASAAQHALERKHFLVRRDLLKYEDSLESSIAFSGSGE